MKILKELEVGDVFVTTANTKYQVRIKYEDGVAVSVERVGSGSQNMLIMKDYYLEKIYEYTIKPLTPAEKAAKEKLEAAGFKVSR